MPAALLGMLPMLPSGARLPSACTSKALNMPSAPISTDNLPLSLRDRSRGAPQAVGGVAGATRGAGQPAVAVREGGCGGRVGGRVSETPRSVRAGQEAGTQMKQATQLRSRVLNEGEFRKR